MPREHPLALHRMVLAGVVTVLGALALLALVGPHWLQRFYRPLQHEGTIARAADEEELDPYLVAAVINVESGFQEHRVSRRGAIGLMQLMPRTAEEVRKPAVQGDEVSEEALKDPGTNIELGAAYLKKLLRRYDGDLESALAAYNAGPTNADRWRSRASSTGTGAGLIDSIGFPETRRYVAEVLRQREEYERLYPDAFRRPSEGVGSVRDTVSPADGGEDAGIVGREQGAGR